MSEPNPGLTARLIQRMTIEEKVAQLGMVMAEDVIADGRVDRELLDQAVGEVGVGFIEAPRMSPADAARAAGDIHRYFKSNTRLGLAPIMVGETLHGHMSPEATMFPQAITQASSWNPQLIREMGRAIGEEALSTGVALALAPNLDLARDPRWGRTEETYGEDPYLIGELGLAYINGLHSAKDRQRRLGCTAKHFVAYGTSEGGMNLGPSSVGYRELITSYLPPFARVISEGGVDAIMPSYNEIDGIPLTCSEQILGQLLRKRLGFEGVVFSDYEALDMLVDFHHVACDLEDAAAQAFAAGVDVEAPRRKAYHRPLVELVRRGEIKESDLDRTVSRVLRLKHRLGLLIEADPAPNPARAKVVVGCKAHHSLALRMARESIVLLTNPWDTLPLDPSKGRVAVLGPNATIAQLGDYSTPKPDLLTPLDAVRRLVADKVEVLHARGCELTGLNESSIPEAVELARSSDVAIAFVGDTSHYYAGVGWGESGGIATSGEGFDRTELTLPGMQGDLVRQVIKTGTPTVVVLVNGRPYTEPWIYDHAAAVVEAWYPGEAGSRAMAEVLFGLVNPSGKLPISIPQSVGHIPSHYNHKPSARGYYGEPGTPHQPGRDFVFSSPGPRFRFGYGLSYTKFEYTSARLSAERFTLKPNLEIGVEVSVTNTGKRNGMEVVQLYLSDEVSTCTRPIEELRRFQKVRLKAGETREVVFKLKAADLAMLNRNDEWVVEPGFFRVKIGTETLQFNVLGNTPLQMLDRDGAIDANIETLVKHKQAAEDKKLINPIAPQSEIKR